MKKSIPKRRRRAIGQFEAALVALSEGRYAEAREGLEAIITKYKHEIDLIERTRLYLKRIDLLESASADGDGEYSADQHFKLGIHYYNRGNPDQARVHFNACLELEPDNAPALYNLACLTARPDGDVDGAMELLQKAVELQPGLRKQAVEDPDLTLAVQKLEWIEPVPAE